uniref:UDP-glycosyltransferase CGT n=1 Tax=Leersia perrieri TaxID=77586 RepID=A0A0D9WPE2_9ORYZ
MGHLVPFTRLAVALCSGHHGASCEVSLVTATPTVSSAESRHLAALFAAFPALRRLDLRLAPLDHDAPDLAGADPFYLRYESMRRSAASLMAPLLAGASVSALVADIALASVVIPVTRELRLPCYVFFTASATMLTFLAYLPTYLDAAAADAGGVCRVPRSSVPQALHDADDIFTLQFIANGRSLVGADGLIVNAFDAFEPEAIAALQQGTVVAGLPPVFAVGPLTPARFPGQDSGDYLTWLDAQPARSVVYVSFGSRKALPKSQLTSLAAGLELSGHRFLWVVKSTVVDRDDAGEIASLLGEEFLDRVHGGRRGHVTTAWVRQELVLNHPAVGMFVSHCGWNSVTEAAAAGVPVLAWPRFADQRVNAAVVARGGIGSWAEERWSWEGEEGVVSAEEIAGMVKSVMAYEAMREKAARVRVAAAKAVADATSLTSTGEANSDGTRPHVVFVPTAGMGHFHPFFRFIAALSTHDAVDISIVTVLPTVSAAEADHLAALFADFPAVRRIDLHLLPIDAAEFPAGADTFLLRWEALRRSAHLLGPLLAAATPRATAVVTDIVLASHVIPIARELRVQCHVLFISCATMLSLCAYFPVYLENFSGDVGDVDIPGVGRVARSSLPQPLLDPEHLFTRQFVANGGEICKADGVVLNTFDALEPDTLAALRNGTLIPNFPPVFAVGPFKSLTTTTTGEKKSPSPPLAWLDEQSPRSVVYVAFGNRTAVTPDQLSEIAAGLESSGCNFLWVLKTTVVDRDDDADPNIVLGEDFLSRVRGRGHVTKGWVEQEEILSHPAVALFISHCGWNSVVEAAERGVPVLAWPRAGDQRLDAMVVERSGLGVWMEKWSWNGEEGLVSGEEIGRKVREVMDDSVVRATAAKVGEEAAKAVAVGGSSYRSMQEFLVKLKAA